MGNTGSSGSGRHSRRSNIPPPTPPPHQAGNRYVFAAATPYPSQYNRQQQPQYYSYPGYLPPPPPLPSPQQVMPGPYGPHYGQSWGGGHYPYGGCSPPILPYIEHQKAVTIRNDVNVKKESLRVEPDEENPGKFLVSFTYDATAPGSLTVMFFAKEAVDCDLTATREDLQKPITVSFEQGLGQRFRQLTGTGIDFSMLDEKELTVGDGEVYPLIIKAEANPLDQNESSRNPGRNSQITQAVFTKEKGEHMVQVVKQILWVNGMRYELQEIYGIGNPVDSELDDNDIGKECVICLSEPRDTTVLPCRHMGESRSVTQCMCSGCAKLLRFQTNRCPICRQPVERLLEIKVNGDSSQ